MPDVFFSGSAGRLEARYTGTVHEGSRIALVLHPHPVYGGSMHNKVVYTLYTTLKRRGFSVLRLNFRGVGRSEGAFDKGEGELLDAADALDWLQVRHPDADVCAVAGFSFGAWVAMQLLMRRPEIKWFVGVAPPVKKFDFSFVSPCPADGLIIQGSNDTIADASAVCATVDRWNERAKGRVRCALIENADHFFAGKHDVLAAEVNRSLDDAEPQWGDADPSVVPEVS